MSSRIERMAADDTAGTPNARTNVTSAEVILLTDAGLVAGQFAKFLTTTTTTHIRWGTAGTVTVDHTTRNTGTPPATTAAANAPHETLVAGIEKRMRIPPGTTHFAHISEAATGVLRFCDATGEG